MTKGASIVTVFGSSRAPEGGQQYEEGRVLGRMLAERGYQVLCGGYGGIMEAVSRGAWEGGQKACGITVKTFDPLRANPWLGEERKAHDLFQRLQELILPAKGYILLKGGLGTLTELALTWTLVQMRQLRGRPIILVGSHWQPILRVLSQEMEIRANDLRLLSLVDSAEEAVEMLERTTEKAKVLKNKRGEENL